MRRFDPNAYGNPTVAPRPSSKLAPDTSAQSQSTQNTRIKENTLPVQSTTTTTQDAVGKHVDTSTEQVLRGKHASEYESTRAKHAHSGKKHGTTGTSQGTSIPSISSDQKQKIVNAIKPNHEPVDNLTDGTIKPPSDSQHTQPNGFEKRAGRAVGSDLEMLSKYTKTALKIDPTGQHLPVHGQSSFPAATSHKQALSAEELLRQARGNALKEIHLKNRGAEKDSTTSVRDLYRARKSVPIPNLKMPPPVNGRLYDTGSQTVTQPCAPATSRMFSVGNSHIQSGPSNGYQSNQPNITSERIHPVQPACEPNSHSGFAANTHVETVDNIADDKGLINPSPRPESQASKDSMQPLHLERVTQNRTSAQTHPLMGWDGHIQPPPADWHDRPRFRNDSAEFHNDFDRWTLDVCRMTMGDGNGAINPVPSNLVQDIAAHADGISMVAQDMTISKQNAQQYGYEGTDVEETMKYAQPMSKTDFEDWGKLDMARPENISTKDETTNQLVSNWVRVTHEQRKRAVAEIEHQEHDMKALFDYRPANGIQQPQFNFYLRPASTADIDQMTNIYNWHIGNGPRPAETYPITEDEMQDRLDNATSNKLPFIVAVEKSASAVAAAAAAMSWDMNSSRQVDGKDKVVGWACAQHLTAADYVERITAELEIYVDSTRRQSGIGKCLMDKLLEACDRGHMTKGGYPFLCPGETRHLYSAGGGCDLHKLIFVCRKWKKARTTSFRSVPGSKAPAKSKKRADDLENDYDVWLRQWIEAWGFEVEGMLKGVGAKNGRFVDVVHLCKETGWQPAEGRIPDPRPAA